MSTLAFTVMFAVWLMFGILGVPISKELGLSKEQFSWVLAAATLNGSMWRLPAGIITDRIGGRKVMTFMLLASAIPTYFVSKLGDSYAILLVLAFLIGFAGNSFSVGIAWNAAWFTRHRQGFALGVFGAGNVGASVTKLIGPGIIAATAGGSYALGVVGGWRLIPVLYAALLVVIGIGTWFITPAQDRAPGSAKPLREMLAPLKHVRVWRFSLYYVAVFGAYVALSGWLPTYLIDNFQVSLTVAGLLTTLFIFPASLLRPLGGWISDRWGARRAMYVTFAVMLVTSGVLMMPNGHIVIVHPDGRETQHLGYSISLVAFMILVFLLGCAMGVGKAAVYKHIPEYFPDNVGSVGGLVGMLGGLGGFFLPPMFAYTQAWSGFPSATFFVLFILVVICFAWMHWTIHRMLHSQAPDLAGSLEDPTHNAAASGHARPDAPPAPLSPIDAHEEARA
jgi:NNP family nitrate/nitrite transporter-like MFS transporter